MIKEKLYNYSEIENANFNFDLCTEKEHFLQALRISVPVKVKNFNTKGTNYSLEYDKFYMYISHTNKYKELRECIHHGYPSIHYYYNNKNYEINTTKFRKNNLNKK